MEPTGDLLMSAARALRRRYAAALSEWDITPSQGRALRMVVAADEPPRLSAVAEKLRIKPRSATEVIDALQARDLVERSADPCDRRATCVRATDSGRRLAAVIDEAREEEVRAYLSVLDPSDRTALARILEKLAANS
ncbi:MAG: winged helix DNA-binding protein [Nocardioides sp.]|nr:winged helix DNA-binding protein [Nocardioides sp.]